MPKATRTDRIDAVLTHRIAGPILFFLILALVFQSVFAWAGPFMNAIEGATANFGDWLGAGLPEGPIRSLLIDGVIADPKQFPVRSQYRMFNRLHGQSA